MVIQQGRIFGLGQDRKHVCSKVVVRKRGPVIAAIVGAVIVRAGIMFMPDLACCNLVNMIIMMNMVFGRCQRQPVLPYMLCPRRPRHNECAQKQSKSEKPGHVAGIASGLQSINW